MIGYNDEKLESLLGWILRGGLVFSSILLIAGLVLSFLPVGSLSDALLRAGLVLLLATPIARVAASAISYVVAGDWLFVSLTATVLIELGAAVAAAFAHR